MTVYVGTPIGATGIVRLPVCYTGWHATLMRAALLSADALTGAFGGLLVGLLISLVTGPEVVTKIVGAAVGGAAGAFAGAVIATVFLNMSMCPCPPGATGFCIMFIVYVVPGSLIVVPIWPFFGPAPGFCPTLVPPGCP